MDPFVDWEKTNMLTQKILHGLPLDKKSHDGGGLYFVKSSRQTGKWSFRFMKNGRAHEMGLGRYPEVTIFQARSRRNQYQEQLNQGQNPLRERQERRHREQHHQSVRFFFPRWRKNAISRGN